MCGLQQEVCDGVTNDLGTLWETNLKSLSDTASVARHQAAWTTVVGFQSDSSTSTFICAEKVCPPLLVFRRSLDIHTDVLGNGQERQASGELPKGRSVPLSALHQWRRKQGQKPRGVMGPPYYFVGRKNWVQNLADPLRQSWLGCKSHCQCRVSVISFKQMGSHFPNSCEKQS